MTAALLKADGLTRRFGGLTAVDRVSFEVEPGELVSIVGPNGAGKTTLFNLLTGQLRPSEGEVYLREQRITRLRPHQRAGLGMARTFQIVRPLMSLSVRDNAMVGAFLRHRGRRAAERHAMRTLETLGFADRADVPASELTLSERKRLEVARALAGEPQVLLLDEVMAGLNPREAGEAVEIVRRLNAGGLTVLLIEHNLKVVRALAERVIVLDHGATIAAGATEDVLQDPQVVEAYLGARKA
ncbi:MAG: ABC transporter ATP-binding protein [Solirubrobacteraceae bacterium]